MVKEKEWECGSRERGKQKTKPGEKNCQNRVVQTSNTMRCFDNLLGFGILNKVFLHLLGWNVHLTIDSLLLCSYF